MKWYLQLLLTLMSGTAVAQTAAVDISITVTDNVGATQTLNFGLDPSATDSIDAALGESELPPVPPSGVFDARFVGDDISLPQLGQGSHKDYRTGDADHNGVITHEIKFQPGSGTTITIAWQLPDGVSGVLQDLFGGVIVNERMNGDSSYTVTNPGGIGKLKMIASYEMERLALISPNGGEMWIVGDIETIVWESAGVADIEIDYSIDNGANWHDVISSTPAASGHFSWTVPATISSEAKLRIRDASDGTPSDESNLAFVIGTQIGQNPGEIPFEFSLAQNYPNPFNPETTIEFALPEPGHVKVKIYNLLGQEIRSLLDQHVEVGWTSVAWNGENNDGRQVTSGVYLYRIEAGEFSATRKLVLMR